MELRPESADGLLLYNGNERIQDFIAVALTRRHVELRLICATKPALLQSLFLLILFLPKGECISSKLAQSFSRL